MFSYVQYYIPIPQPLVKYYIPNDACTSTHQSMGMMYGMIVDFDSQNTRFTLVKDRYLNKYTPCCMNNFMLFVRICKRGNEYMQNFDYCLLPCIHINYEEQQEGLIKIIEKSKATNIKTRMKIQKYLLTNLNLTVTAANQQKKRFVRQSITSM